MSDSWTSLRHDTCKMRPELANGLPYFYRDTEVSGAPLHGSSLTQFEEQEQSNCKEKAEKYVVELPVLKSFKNYVSGVLPFIQQKR